jgi:hypothetical protein
MIFLAPEPRGLRALGMVKEEAWWLTVIYPLTLDGVPPPNQYQMKSDFTKNPGSNAFSFGIAREAYSKVYLKEHPSDAAKKSIPGPGCYQIGSIIGTEGLKYSMRPRTNDPSKFSLILRTLIHKQEGAWTRSL